MKEDWDSEAKMQFAHWLGYSEQYEFICNLTETDTTGLGAHVRKLRESMLADNRKYLQDIFTDAIAARKDERYISLCCLVLDYARDKTDEKWNAMINGAYDKWEEEPKPEPD